MHEDPGAEPPGSTPSAESAPSQDAGLGGKGATGGNGADAVTEDGGGGSDGAPEARGDVRGSDVDARGRVEASDNGGAPGAEEPTVLALETCNLNAPFEAPIASFTGTMNVNGLTFSPNGLTAYISGPGPVGSNDIFVSTRATLDSPFSAPSLVTGGLNTQASERSPAISSDGLTLYLTKSLPNVMNDTVRAVWDPSANTFSAAQAITGSPNGAPNSNVQDEDPFWWQTNTNPPTKIIYFASERPDGVHRDIWMTTVSGTTVADTTFSAPTKVQNVNSSAEEFHPVVSPDGLTMYLTSRRGGIGGDTDGDVFMAHRNSLAEQFSTASDLWSLNNTGIEHPLAVSPSGCTLYFVSNEETGLSSNPNTRLYQATRGTSIPSQVALTLNIIGTGSVTTAPFNCSTGNVGTCTVSAAPNTTMVVFASSQAGWTGSCAANGSIPSTDGVLTFAQNAVCSIKFPNSNPVSPGGLCSLSMDCQAGLQCTNNHCAGGHGTSCTDDAQCGNGLVCWQDGARHFDKPGGTGVCTPPICRTNVVAGGCGDLSQPCGLCTGTPRPCTTNANCVTGEVCGTNNGARFGLAPDGDYCWPPDCNSPTTPPRCGTVDSACGLCDGACAHDSDCPAGQACLIGYGPHFGKARGTNVCGNPNCLTHPMELGCGFEGATCGKNCNGGIGCTTNADCPSGEVCGIGLGRSVGLIAPNACVPPICVSDPVAGGCDHPGSPCGTCQCTPSCDNKHCGDDGSNGCGGTCRGFCNTREPGCQQDSDCRPGDACVFGGGPRIGLPEGTNACLPAKCLDPNPARQPCGNTSSECGSCPTPPDDVCEDRECGVEPSYGVHCGSDCSAGLACVAGKCVRDFTPGELELPTKFGGNDVVVRPGIPTNDIRQIVPGAVEGSFSVSDRGRAIYQIPIVAPPARAGMEPNISLKYSSGTKNGLLGVGWSIEGLSSIARCPKIAATNGGWVGPVEYTNDDQLCLDGNPLVITEGEHFTVGAVYHTEVDTFDRVKIIEMNGHLAFEVRKKDGRIFTYGGSHHTELYRWREERLVRAWPLARIRDRVGNFIDFRYGVFVSDSRRPEEAGQDQTVEFWPSEIAYGGIDTPGLFQPARRFILFEYENGRNDYMEGFTRGGGRVARTKLLKRVSTKLGTTVVRTYDLTYAPAPLGAPILGRQGIPRLHAVKECAQKTGLTQCKRPTTFDYLDEQGLVANARGFADAKYSTASVSNRSQLIVLDWNGDGRDDLFPEGDGMDVGGPVAVRTLVIATGDPENPYRKVATPNITFIKCFGPNSVFDFNGDGKDDLYDLCEGSIFVSTGDPDNPFVQDLQEGPGDGTNYLVDINGDGIKDMFTCSPLTTHIVEYRLGKAGDGIEGKNFGEPQGVIEAWGSCDKYNSVDNYPSPILTFDIDADGADDILMYAAGLHNSGTWARYVPHSANGAPAWIQLPMLPSSLGKVVGSHGYRQQYGLLNFVDVNGDGLKDIFGLLTEDRSQYEPTIFTNLGGTFDFGIDAYNLVQAGGTRDQYLDLIQQLFRPDDVSVGRALIADYTGDGREDVMRLLHTGDVSAQNIWQLDVGGQGDPGQALAGLPMLQGDAAAATDGDTNQFVPNPDIRPVYRFGSDSPGVVAILADADGDGSKDLVMLTTQGQLAVMKGRFGREHLLARVTDGIGKRITISYDATQGFTDGMWRTHTPAAECLDTDKESGFSLCARDIGPLVNRYLVQTEQDGIFRIDRSFALRYEGAREGLLGRGFLGYDKRVIEERLPDNSLIKRTEILEDNRSFGSFDRYVYAGLEKRRIVTSAYAESTLASGATFQRVTTINDWGDDRTLFVSDAGRPFPALHKSETQVEEVGADFRQHLSTVKTEYEPPDGFGNITHKETTVRDGRGIVTQTAFDATYDIRAGEDWLVGLPKRETIEEDVVRDVDPPVVRVTEHVFDEKGLIYREIREPDEDQNAATSSGLRQETVYDRGTDLFGVVRKVTTSGRWIDEDGNPVSGSRVTSLEYDPVETVFPEHVYSHHGAVTCSFAASRSAQCQTTDISYDPRDGTMVSRVDPTGVGETMAFDPFGRVVRHETPTDKVAIRYQDAQAIDPLFPVFPKIEIIATSEVKGARSTRRLDALGRVVQQEESGLGGAILAHEIEYLSGNLISTASRPHVRGDATQGTVQQFYDERLRVTRTMFGDGAHVDYQYAPTTFMQGPVGPEDGETFVTGVTDPNGHQTLSFKNARGQVVRSVDAKRKSIRFEHAPFGSIHKIIEPIQGDDDHVTLVDVDKLGRTNMHDDGDSGRTRYTYTAFDEVAVQTDNAAKATGFHYDDLGRLERKESPDGTAQYAYDGPGQNAIGRLVEMTSPDEHIEHYTYQSRPSGALPPQNPALLESVDRVIEGDTFSLSFHYNDKFQLEKLTYPPTPAPAGSQAFAVHYGYDQVGNLACVSDRAVPTPDDCGTGRYWKLEEAFQGYRVKSESFGNGVTSTYGYDNLNGNLRGLTTALGNTAYQSITYPFYDANGNLRHRIENFRSPNGGPNTVVDATFHYDELDRLTDVLTQAATLQHLDYADNGNILAKADVGDYDYARRAGDPLRHPHGVRAIKRGGVEVATFNYDAVGNMTSRSGQGVDGGTQTTSYTSFNLPNKVTIGSGPVGAGSKEVRYEYDALQHRVVTKVESDGDSGSEDQRIYVGDAYERQVTEDAGGPVTRHIYKVFAQGRQVAQVEREQRSGVTIESKRYLHRDHQGSSQVITDETGTLVHVQRFDAFGKLIAPASEAADAPTRSIRAGFTGHETDVETGLVNMRGRIYDPRLGRFMQADPIFHAGLSQWLNRYAYALNNPLNVTDPSGLEPDDDDNDGGDNKGEPGAKEENLPPMDISTLPSHASFPDPVPTDSNGGNPNSGSGGSHGEGPSSTAEKAKDKPASGGTGPGPDKQGDNGGTSSPSPSPSGPSQGGQTSNPDPSPGVVGGDPRGDDSRPKDHGAGGGPNQVQQSHENNSRGDETMGDGTQFVDPYEGLTYTDGFSGYALWGSYPGDFALQDYVVLDTAQNGCLIIAVAAGTYGAGGYLLGVGSAAVAGSGTQVAAVTVGAALQGSGTTVTSVTVINLLHQGQLPNGVHVAGAVGVGFITGGMGGLFHLGSAGMHNTGLDVLLTTNSAILGGAGAALQGHSPVGGAAAGTVEHFTGGTPAGQALGLTLDVAANLTGEH